VTSRLRAVSRLIFWTQVLIVVFVLAGIVIAAVKL
jgi:predicted membrane protein